MKIEKEQVLKIVSKNLNISGLFADLLDEILEPIIQEFVADSSNPYDDMLVAAMYPILERELKAKIEELVGKLFAEEEEVVA